MTYIIPLPFALLNLESVWQKCEYLDNENSLLDEIKYIFHSFWRPIISWKNEHLIKIADTSLKRQYFIKFNSFQVNKSFLYPLKTSENQRLFLGSMEMQNWSEAG